MGLGKGCIVGIVIAVCVTIVVISLVASSLKRLDSFEVGLKYDTIWKKLSKEPSREGLHTGPPGFQFLIFPNIFQSITFPQLTCLNKDGVKIDLDVSFQYKTRSVDLRTLVLEFQDHENYLVVLEAAGKAAIHDSCSLFNTSQFQSDRGKFQEDVSNKILARYDILMADVSEIQVNNIQRPSSYETAIKAKEAARENIKVAENQRPRKITTAQTAMLEAETQAQITIQKAKSQARILENQANADAEAILNHFDTEAQTYEELMASTGLALTQEGFLSYMGIRAVSQAANPVYIGMDAPAKTSYV